MDNCKIIKTRDIFTIKYKNNNYVFVGSATDKFNSIFDNLNSNKKISNKNHELLKTYYKNSKPIKKLSFPVFYQNKDLNNFYKNTDVLISILPATLKTYNFITKDSLKLMKKRALLINVGRGSSINEKDLINHLIKNKFFYASLDVFKEEPLPKKHPFWSLQNVTVTPHIASMTVIISAVHHMYNKYKEFKKNKKFQSDVDYKKGY